MGERQRSDVRCQSLDGFSYVGIEAMAALNDSLADVIGRPPSRQPFSFTGDTFGPWEAAVLVSVASAMAVFSVVTNAVIIYLSRTSTVLKPLGPLRIFVGSMALADLLIGLVIMPVALQYSITKQWVFGVMGCKVRLQCGSAKAELLVQLRTTESDL